MRNFYAVLGVFLGTIFLNLNIKAQVPTCGSDVPYFQVDLTGQPAGTWISPSHARKGNCCGTISPDRCTSFEIILDTGAAMINFEIASGAIPPGSMFYQIDCGPQVAVGQPICISGVGPHHLTFCKPGNNENTYGVTSIAKPIIPKSDSTRIGCSLPLDIYGLDNITINAIDPDPAKVSLYNSYLSCTNCSSFDFSPGAGAPAYIDYEVCGTPQASACGYIFTCDTMRLYVYSSLNGSVTPNPAEFCSGGPGVLLTASGAGGNGNYTYNWYNSSNLNIASGATYNATSQQIFTAEISDGLNSPTCPSKFISVPVSVGLPPVVNAGTDQTVCANDPQIVLNGTVTNATGGIWSGGSGTFSPSNTSLLASYTPTSTEIANGSVTLTLTSTGAGGGCVDDADQIIITFSDTTNITFTTPSILCNGDVGTLTANVTSGTPPYSYVWSNGSTNNYTTAGAGSFWVDVTDNIGCIHRESISLTEPSELGISLTSTDVTTNGGSDGTASVSVTGGTPAYTYSWSSGGTSATETGLSYGIVSVTVTDANGCSITGSIVVNEPQCSSFSTIATATDVSCFGGHDGTAAALSSGGTPPYNYSWNTTPATSGSSISGLQAGAYTVTVSDAGSCVDVATVIVAEPSQLTNSMTHIDNTVIGGTAGEATANPSGGTPSYIYSWSPGGATTQTITNLAAGTYYVDIRDANSCVISDSVNISEPPCNNFSIGVTTTNVSCYWGSNGEASLTIVHGTAPYTINWSDGQTGMTATGLVAGTYSVSVTDASNCTNFETFTITEPSLLDIGLTATGASCYGYSDGTIDLSVTGGTFPYSFTWYKGGDIISSAEDLINLPQGTYSVVVTDANGCSIEGSAGVTQPTQLNITSVKTNATCSGYSDGAIDITPTGGILPYTYSWSSGQNTQDISSLSFGLYTVTLTDANNCTLQSSSYIDEPDPVVIHTITASCPNPGETTTIATVDSITGGDETSYNISFDNGTTYNGLGNYSVSLPIGATYQVVAMDGNGCSTSSPFSFSIDGEVLIDSVTFDPCFASGTTTIPVTVYPNGGAGGPFQVSTDNGVTFGTAGTTVFNLAVGTTYQIVVKDVNGCRSVATTATIPNEITATPSINTQITCLGGNDGSIVLDVAGGVSPYTYAWTGPSGYTSTSKNINGLYEGTYDVTVTDANGCSGTGSITMTTVTDVTPPTITCPSDITTNNDAGNCGASVTYTAPIGTDECPLGTHTTLTAGLASGDFFNVGTTLVTYTVTDSVGNSASCSFNVTVNDVEAPTIACPADVSVNPDPNSCSATGVTLGSPVTGDNCGVLSTSNDAPSSFPNGNTTVTWTVTDIHGNTNTCTQTVTVTDAEPPTITCPAPVSVTADPGLCSASGISLGTPSTNDNCTVASVTNDAPTTFPVGTTTVTWTVTDAAGNSATCTQSVTVTDDENPSITCAANVTVYNDAGNCSTDAANVGLGNPSTSDNCGVATITNNAPATYPVGTTTVTWIVTDIHGNTATCTQNVTVIDNENPVVVSCAAPVTQTADPGACQATGVNLGTPTANDNCGVATMTNDAPATFPVGTTTVTWTITDVNGNSVTCTQTVTITDDENPTISCPAPVSVTSDPGLCSASGVTLGTPTTNDNCAVVSVTNDAPSTFTVGTTTVTWTVTDPAGNTATCTQDVTVTDNENPTITCAGDVTVFNDPTNCSASASNVSLGNPSTNDNCGIASTTNNAPATFPVGTTTVTWTVTDIHGNSATCTQNVTVVDNEAPVVISCAAPVSQTADPGICGATNVFLGTPTANDNCGIATMTNDAPALFPVGVTTVTWTITDIHGNSTTCTQTVTITDDENPTITCPSDVTVNNDPDVCFASNVSLGTPTTNDNCGVVGVRSDAPATFPVGTTTVTWTVTDESGNTATCTQNVTVIDNQLPTISCPGSVTVANDAGNCSTDSINVTLGTPTVNDNCGIDTVFNNAPATFPVGNTNVTWTVVDIHGNSSVCVQVVTIVDQEVPQILSCAPPVNVTADPNVCEATNVSLGTPTVNDNCGIATVTNDAPTSFPVGTTTVTWTITDIHGNQITCTQQVTVTDDENPTITCPPTANVSNDTGYCYATNVNLGTPIVNDNCGVATVTNNAPSIFPVGTTTVTWVVTDIHNNTDTCYQDVIVNDTEVPTLTMCPADTASCDPVIYYQAPTASDNCGIATIIQISGFGPGATFPVGTTTEVWEITDIHGNVSHCSFDVTIHPLPLPSLATTDVSCYSFGDGTISTTMLDGTAPYNYTWSNGDSTQNIDSLVPGTYNVLVTDFNGCQGSATATISQPDTLQVTETHTNISCYGLSDGAIDITVDGGTTPYGYTWSTGANSQDLTAIPFGIYDLTVTDLNNCSYDISIEVTQPDSLEAYGTVVDAICEGPNGGIDLTIVGGTTPYNYLWSNGDTIQDIDSVTLGVYSVNVTDANGCTVSYQDTVGSYSVMSLGRDIYHPLCYGDFGAIDLTVIEGTAPYTFTWSNGDTTQNISDIPAGTYSVTVTDANLCAQSATYEVIQPDSLALDFIVSEYTGGYGVSGYGEQDGEIDMTIYGGTQPYSIQWNPRSSDEDLFDLSAGTYYVTVTDLNGCTVYGEVEITQPMDLAIPTGFTPNGDNYNDYFVIKGVEAFPDNELLIYNRWGNLVYSKVGYNNEWNGENNGGERLPDGTYFVVFEIKSGNLDNVNIKIPYSGYVDLRRTR